MMKAGKRGNGRNPGMPADKAKDFKGTVVKLLKFMGPHNPGIVMVCIFAVISTVFNIIGPKVMGRATTTLFDGLMAKIQGTGSIDFTAIGHVLLFTLALYVISAFCQWVQGWSMSSISQKVAFEMRQAISKKIHRLPLKYFESRTTGEVLSRITNDVDTLAMSLNQTITQAITSVATLIGVTVMMLSISPIMTLITVVILPLSLLFMGLVISKSQKYFITQQSTLGDVNGQVEEAFGGQNVIKAFNREGKVIEDFDEANDRLFNSAFKSQFLSGLMMPIMNFVGNLGYVAVAISGAIFAINGKITVGDIQAFIQYVKNFTQPIQQMAQISNQLQSMVAAAERVFEFIEEEEEVQKVPNPSSIEDIKGKVDFNHVKFGYTDDKIVIKDWSLNVKPGQTVAIVGPTGAGKTTMVKLLMRFYDLNSGNILVDDKDITSFNRIELRHCFGMVLQDTWLFKGTIMENIRYGKLDATDEEVIEAAKSAHADKFIRTLPGGYSMVLNEEADNVSQGQKQLITIARAILADNPILILDEATSSVDTRTEHLIQKAMDNLMAGRTSFVIAHRLSTIKDADVIVVMQEGDIVEQGTHKELLEKNGVYAGLYNSQFEEME
ncbi:MAG: ABC transporter ATP-binding protein/permease [Clostridia bacterium]|nr:ABC transporter ATP-binding protein/permease [Clostridia bacterium]